MEPKPQEPNDISGVQSRPEPSGQDNSVPVTLTNNSLGTSPNSGTEPTVVTSDTNETAVPVANSQSSVGETAQPGQPMVSTTPAGPQTSWVGTPAAVVSGGSSAGMVSSGSFGAPVPRNPRKKLWLLGSGIGLLILLLAGGVFGLYLPNTPGNVYNTGITRSGKALDSLVTTATDKSKQQSYKSSDISGSVQAKLADGEYSGDFTTTFDKASLQGGLNVTLKNADLGSKTLSAKVVSKLPAGSSYPNVYFQLSGFKDLGLDSFVPGVSAYDGTWIKIDSGYLKSIGSQFLGSSDNTASDVTADDISQLAKTSVAVTRQYVFTTNSDKNVLTKQSYKGKEKMDGMTTYHYTVSVNADHAKAYCVALSNAVIDTAAYKKLSNQTASDRTQAKKDAETSCKSGVDDMLKDGNSFDMWVDGKYKLIHKIRFYDKTDKNNYADIGQTYKGGDDITFFARSHDDGAKMDDAFSVTINPKTTVTSGNFQLKSTDSQDPYTVTANFKAAGSNKPINVTEPTNSVLLQDVLKKFGIDSDPVSSLQANASDTERKTDIMELDSQLEAAYVMNGFYPTLAQLNSSSWRAANMEGLDEAALKTPTGTATVLVAQASATQYGYVPSGCSSDGCSSFTLTAILSDGSAYTKESF